MRLNPSFVALSDALVLVALERAASRDLPGSVRMTTPAAEKHRLYERFPIAKLDYALTDAWALLPRLVKEHKLGVDPAEWELMLDSYTRSLIMMCQPHELAQLTRHLEQLVPDEAALRVAV